MVLMHNFFMVMDGNCPQGKEQQSLCRTGHLAKQGFPQVTTVITTSWELLGND
jgi:hypothetical protein